MTNSPKSPQLKPGMLGDGTEEQNLNQKGDPSARVTQADVDTAFDVAKDKPAASGKGSVTDQVSNDLSDAEEAPEDALPKDNSHNFN